MSHLAHLEALNCNFYDFSHFLKAEIHQIDKIQGPKDCKNVTFQVSTF